MANRTEIVTEPAGPAAAVDRLEAVAYDPYDNRRAAAHRVMQIIGLVVGMVEGLLAIRFVLKAFGANPSADFASFIYGITNVLVAPFVGLFGNPQSSGSLLELTTIVAMIVSALLAWLLSRLAWIVIGDNRSAVAMRSTSVDTRA